MEGWHDSKVVDFYSPVASILELHYMGGNKVYIFECKWWNIGDKKRGKRVSKHFTSVNTTRLWYTDDPFILATQAKQVFYPNDPSLWSDWRVVQKFTPKSVYEGSLLSKIAIEPTSEKPYQEDAPSSQFARTSMHLDGSITPLHKEDLTLEPVDISAIAEL